ncbi:Anti-sigma-K factor rskA [Stieleria neptunia]|uniref:Anti-sigma-K factor rskA n=1 Tax=Stieleria neptunia TaxID=2527979 RepID=A0A518HQ93_9BACT|nr:anti-sigma factor [Stieleria neptunia]QDV43024.1 Anti-sigma-K factor rskA [Stieleria neptunia]
MSNASLNDPTELELMAGYVLGDLNEAEADQLKSVLGRDERAAEILHELEMATAAVQLATMGLDDDPMPEVVADRIRTEGRRIIETRSAERQRPEATVSVAAKGVSPREWVAWFCAAAAVLLAITLWQRDPGAADRNVREARAAMLRQSASLLRVDWTPGKTPFDQPVIGDVVWDSESQTGFMRFENMPINDPTAEQYQLWIIDPQRDDEPIDGGVFDVTKSGEVIVEIDAKLNVISPAAFAITIEKPGGVVVSTQERLPLLAAVN